MSIILRTLRMFKAKDIEVFDKVGKKTKNDKNNKLREQILVSLYNDEIAKNILNNKKYGKLWINLHKQLITYINSLFDKIEYNHNSNDPKPKLIIKGGRRYNYDFEFKLDNKKFNPSKQTDDDFQIVKLEFKFNCDKITDLPQFSSPGKPSVFLSKSYEEFFFDNYFNELYKCKNVSLAINKPSKDEYLKTINSTSPKCVSSFKVIYKLNNTFCNHAKKVAKDSINEFIHNNDVKLDIEKLSQYLLDSQTNKHFILYDKKNKKFIYEEIKEDMLKIKSYSIYNHNSYEAITESNHRLKIMLRWKNGNGIAFPAFQISLMKKKNN